MNKCFYLEILKFVRTFVKNVMNFTKEQMIEFAEFCFRKYLIEGYSEEVTHGMLFDMWLKSKG